MFRSAFFFSRMFPFGQFRLTVDWRQDLRGRERGHEDGHPLGHEPPQPGPHLGDLLLLAPVDEQKLVQLLGVLYAFVLLLWTLMGKEAGV